MEKGLVAGVIAILLGILAVLVGWTIIGGLVLGLIALLLAMRSYREGHRLLGAIGIVFACVGLVEGALVAGMVGFSSILTMPTRAEVTTTPTLKTETVTRTVTVTMQATTTTIIKETTVTSVGATETVKKELAAPQPQTFKWKLLWERRLNDTVYNLAVSPSGNFVSLIAGLQLIVFSRNGDIYYNVSDGITYYTTLLSVSDEGESWVFDSNFQKGSKELAMVKDGAAAWVVDLRETLTSPSNFYLSIPSPKEEIAISRDGKYIVIYNSYNGWIHFCRKENNTLHVLWKFKPVDESRVAISNDNRYISASGNKWVALLDNQGKLIWEKDIIPYGPNWSPPYFISNSNMIGISSSTNDLVLIVDLEGQLIRKIPLKDEYVMLPNPIVVNNLIIGVAWINGTEVLRVYDWDGNPIYTYKPKGDNILTIACSLDGKYIALSDNALRVYLLEREG